MQTSNVTQKGQVTVPAKLRRELGIKPGGRVRFVRSGKGVLIEAVREPEIDSVFGVLVVPRQHRGAKFVKAIDAARHRETGPRR
ncbi:MAG TPA: AbrB/MazE/SpoVT family DNA-binding domain-containing protein [Rhodanobacteraceae bacterium]|nr:AbrB/MazE/SpoVT family DNA-binding domain-containing protein [Rhodanobacteraceae bacterium]